jgi:Tfp pilus assembly protein PilO
MRTGGLKRVHIVIIGVVLGLLAAVGIYFAAIKPVNESIAELQSETEGYQTKAATKPTAEKALATAQQKQAVERINLQRWETKYMRLGPEQAFFSLKDPQQAMILLWKEHANTVGPLLTKFIRRSGVRLVSQIQIPGAPVDPNAINTKEYTVPLGQVQVVGTFANINRFLRSVQNAPRLLRVNNVELQGQSPNISATVDMTMIVLPRDTEKFQAVPLATGDAAAGGTTTTYGGYPTPGGGYPTPGGGGANGAGGGSNGG